MRRRVSFFAGSALFLCWLLAWSSSASAQLTFVESSQPAVAIAAPVDGVLERGKKLETQRRWGEALSLYEEALRNHPHDPTLEQRFSLARTHYDLARRYSDSSFRDSLTALSFRESLELYAEVLAKIQTHYVEAPDWDLLVRRGTQGFEAALTDPVFVERNLPGMPSSRIEHFKRQLRDYMATRASAGRASSRQEARDLVAVAAQYAHDQLGLLETAVTLEYVSGATNALDQYSTYLTAGQLNEVYSQIEGNFVGLGVELKAADGALLIVKVITGSPAERGGIRANDRIVAVDGRSTSTMNTDQAANMLQGKEGSMVDVTAVSPGQHPRIIRIRREQVEVPSVDSVRIVDAAYGVAYLKLTCFQKTTSRDLDTALWKLHREGMRSLIIDLRGNPGGLLTTSVDVVDKFVDKGIIVSTRGRSSQEDYNYSARQAGTWRVPLVVLIDGDSASASEIFAGAIRDHRRGLIVGTRSYGKGSVQGIFPLNVANSGLRLTTAKFYSPRGLPFSQIGVSPDLLVQQAAKPVVGDDAAVVPMAGDPDPVFDAGVREARRQVARK